MKSVFSGHDGPAGHAALHTHSVTLNIETQLRSQIILLVCFTELSMGIVETDRRKGHDAHADLDKHDSTVLFSFAYLIFGSLL